MSDNFAIGQRYLSDSESSLGLGVVVALDERSVTVLFPQSEEMRVYAKSAMALSRVVFATGDTVTDIEGRQHTVAQVEIIEGVLRYQLSCGKSLMETRLSANVNLAKPLDRLLAGKIASETSYQLRCDALRLQNFIAKHPLQGLMGARVDIIPHQKFNSNGYDNDKSKFFKQNTLLNHTKS